MELKLKDRPFVFAHRGASGYLPENTMAAFEKAVEMQADGIELDVQLSKDGQLIVMHDETLNRTTGVNGFVKDYNFADIRQMNACLTKPDGHFYQVPTLQEVLQLIKTTDMILNIELKSSVFPYPGIEEKTVELVKQYDLQKQVIYSSFSHYSLLKIQQLDPQAYTGFLYSDDFIDVLPYIKEHHGNAAHPAEYFLLRKGYIDQAKQLGLEVNTYTVNKKEEMLLARQLGVTGIFTNYPDVALELYKH